MLTKDEIIKEATMLASADPIKKDSAFVLNSLLNQIKPIDFKRYAFDDVDKLQERKHQLTKATTAPDGSVKDDKKAELEELSKISKELESKKLYQKHYKIIFTEKVLEIAEEKGWPLCHKYGAYYAFNGINWIKIEEPEFKLFLGKGAEKAGVPKFDARDIDFANKLFEQFEFIGAKRGAIKEINDTGKVLINFLNGTLEITPEGKIFREHKADDFLTYVLPYEYDPEATAPLFDRTLNEILPEADKRFVLSEFAGYVFTTHLKLEKALFLLGSGANGKSWLMDVLTAVFGSEIVSNFGLNNLTSENGYYRAKLVDKRVNWASDTGERLQSNTFKQLASGEPIEARLPYKEPFMLRNVCKFIFNTNQLPSDVEHTNGFFRRFLIIPFEVTIPEEKQDKQLAQKVISRELPGVLNWVLDGLDRLLKQKGFSECEASKQILAQYKKESDSVAMFTDEMNYKATPEQWTQAKPIYSDYREYCYAEGLKPLARKNFHKRLEALGFFTATKNVGKVVYMRKHQSNGTY